MHSKLFRALRSVCVCTLSLLATVCLAQTTIHVGPGQTYTTIQAGIDAANNGDTVLVAPGTYKENINFNGKAITVTSSGGAAGTIIDGGYKPGLATVTFANGETSATVLSGFTITGGGDTIFDGTSDGGIFINGASADLTGASPTIENNIVTANYCHNIDVEFATSAIVNNEISGVLQNTQGTGADESYCTFGSGLFLGGTPNFFGGHGSTVLGNTIENNLTGSAISSWASQHLLIMNNTIRNNTSGDPGSAFTSANDEGTVIVQNLIYDNTSTCGGAIGFMDGGLSGSEPAMLIANNTLADNLTPSPLSGGSNCINIAQIYPAPYSYGESDPDVLIINNVISGSTSYPAVNCAWYPGTPSEADQPTFEYDILNNSVGPFFGSYCVDVSDKYNNDTSDPQFVNRAGGDFHLKSTSAAIDTGQNSVIQTFLAMTGLPWTQDFDGKQRVQDATGKGCVIDMGAYEYPGTDSQCGSDETLTSSLNPAAAGQSVTFTAQLSSTTGTPTGSIQFLDGTNPLSTQTVSGTGSAAFTTNSLSAGSHLITANYQPTGSFGASTASLAEVINGAATSTALTCLPNPIDISGTAQFTATVTSASGTPAGPVSFADNGAALGTQNLASGATNLAYTGSVAGTHTITATYAATGQFAGSSATCSEVVNALPTMSKLAVAPVTSTYGFPVTLTATVAAATPPGPSVPTGVVTFLNGTTTLGTGTLAAGVATLATNSLAGGRYNLTCMYGGSAIYDTSSCDPMAVTVNAAPTALTLSSSNNPAPALSSITFTSRLTVNDKAAGAGIGLHLSINGQSASVTTDASGSATYTVNNLLPGTYGVAVGIGDSADFLASSAALNQVVTALASSTSLTASPNPGDVNQPVTMTATVVSQATSGPAVSGSVTFYDGTASLGSVQVSGSGVASLTKSFTTVGVHNLTAVYGGDTDYSGSTSAVFAETIEAGDFTISALPGAATVYTGEAVGVQVTVTSLRGFSQLLSLTCVGLPANTTCGFSPAQLTNGQGGSSLVIQTTAPAQNGGVSGSVAGSGAMAGSGALLGVLAFLLPGWRRRRRWLAGLSILLLAIAVGTGMTGCSGPGPVTGGTPVGTYQVAVTATAGTGSTALTHSSVVTLTVNSLF